MLLNIPILISKEIKRMIGMAISENRRHMTFFSILTPYLGQIINYSKEIQDLSD